MAELADALRSGRSESTLMRVQIPPSAQKDLHCRSFFLPKIIIFWYSYSMEILKAIKRHIYILIMILVAIYLIIDLNTRLSTLTFLENQEATLQTDVINLQSTLDTVNDRIDYAKSDTAVEEWARQQGLMRKEDDHVIIPLPGEYETPTPTPHPEIAVTPAPNWMIWKSLIFD